VRKLSCVGREDFFVGERAVVRVGDVVDLKETQ
jgi:hypothetical protein